MIDRTPCLERYCAYGYQPQNPMSDWCTNTATVVSEASPTTPLWNHAPSAGSHRVDVGAMGGVEYPSPHNVAGESILIVGLANGVGVGSGSGADAHPASRAATSVAVPIGPSCSRQRLTPPR